MRRGKLHWMIVVLLSGCGGGGMSFQTPDLGQGFSPDDTTSKNESLTTQEEGFLRIIESDSYAGKMTVFLESSEGVEVGATEKTFTSSSATTQGSIQAINQVLQKYPTIKIRRSHTRTAEEEKTRRQEMESRTGKKFLDWNRVFYIYIGDKTKASDLILELIDTNGVSLIYPDQKRYAPQAAGTTPNLSGLQTYLKPYQDPVTRVYYGGLNIEYAWSQGVFGNQDVMVVINDGGYHLGHEKFDLSNRLPWNGGNNWGMVCSTEYPQYIDDDGASSCRSVNVTHGVATTGIIHAQHEGVDNPGVRGIAPNAWTTVGDSFPPLQNGSIYLFECAYEFSWDGRITCDEDGDQIGRACVPCIDHPLTYASMRELLVDRDVSLFLTAGNGGINLDEVELMTDETFRELCGAREVNPYCWRGRDWDGRDIILVGASQGDRDMVSRDGEMLPKKARFSNCGQKVSLYSWGERVVTTSWMNPQGQSPWGWSGNTNPRPANDDPNRFYTNQFSGTSSAAAIVAGAATLVQSYFKDLADGTPGDGNIAAFRYLTPTKMKEILINSGVEAVTDDGCPIGRQPRMDEAFRLVREFWDQTRGRYPDLFNPEMTAQRIQALHGEGMGVQCTPLNEALSDTLCPEDLIFPPGACTREHIDDRPCIENDVVPHLSKKMDFDEDGRGDLVSFATLRQAQGLRGEWKIDLSSGISLDPECGLEGHPECPPSNDNYGNWDIVINTPINSEKVIPVVEDYNSDGQADLALYDRATGRWYISFTTEATLRGEWNGWDLQINWPNVADRDTWANTLYTRPIPADYNGDKWIDLGVQRSDGHWIMNFNWRTGTAWENLRRFEQYGPEIPEYANANGIKDLAYLTADELRIYPGWACLPSVIETERSERELIWKGPSGLVYGMFPDGTGRFAYGDVMGGGMGGIEDVPVSGYFGIQGEFNSGSFGEKTRDGRWRYFLGGLEQEFISPPPSDIYGGLECKPFIADLDGDNLDERTVMCPNEWRIAYSSEQFANQVNGEGYRHISLGYTETNALPGQPTFGGLSYEAAQNIRRFMNDLGIQNIPPMFDTMITPFDYCALPWRANERPEECQ